MRIAVLISFLIVFFAASYGQVSIHYSDSYGAYSDFKAGLIKSLSIRKENIYRYITEKNKPNDSLLYQTNYYDEQGRIVEKDMLEKDGKSAVEITEFTYAEDGFNVLRRTASAAFGFGYYFNSDKKLSRQSMFQVLTSQPTDTLFNKVYIRSYDLAKHIFSDSLLTAQGEMQWGESWHYDDTSFHKLQSYDKEGTITAYYYKDFDSARNMEAISARRFLEKKLVIREVYYNVLSEKVRQLEYNYDKNRVRSVETERDFTYNPDRTIYEDRRISGLFMVDLTFRHYYFKE
jgi:hypothetical protein